MNQKTQTQTDGDDSSASSLCYCMPYEDRLQELAKTIALQIGHICWMIVGSIALIECGSPLRILFCTITWFLLDWSLRVAATAYCQKLNRSQ